MQGYAKETATGPVPSLYLQKRGETYVRKTTLPRNWKRAWMGMNFSIVGTTGGNSNPTAESLQRLTVLDQLSFGLGNGVGCYGQAGNRFIGLTSRNGSPLSVENHGVGWKPFGAFMPCAAIGDGTSTAQQLYGGGYSLFHNPASLTNYCATIILDMSLTATGLAMQFVAGPEGSYGYSDASDLALQVRMAGMTLAEMPVVSGGWWLTGDPVDLDHVMVRLPYIGNRLRIHALRVMQLA